MYLARKGPEIDDTSRFCTLQHLPLKTTPRPKAKTQPAVTTYVGAVPAALILPRKVPVSLGTHTLGSKLMHTPLKKKKEKRV